MTDAHAAAERIVRNYQLTQDTLRSTGCGVPRPIEDSTDSAVVVALAYQKAADLLVDMWNWQSGVMELMPDGFAQRFEELVGGRIG